MKLYKFNNLSIDEKLAYTGSNGIFLDNYIVNDILINYYAIDKFLVEIIYNTECQSITEIKSMKPGLTQKKLVLH
jgi:hypothetical protein